MEGLANGEYYLVEVETVKGYNLLKGPVKVELEIQYTTDWTKVEDYDEQGNLIKHSTTVKNTDFTNNKMRIPKPSLLMSLTARASTSPLPVVSALSCSAALALCWSLAVSAC